MEWKTLWFIFNLFICNSFSLAAVSVHSGRNDSSESLANISWSSDGVPDFRSLCPYNEYCTSQPLKRIPSKDFTSCCQQCSCDKDCYEIGNCCPDVPFPPTSKLKYPCVSLSEDSLYDEDTNLWYHVIAKCKDLLNALSNPRCYKPTELQDLVVVSNPKTGRVYKNKHCAICNDVHNYINWKLQTNCPGILLFDFQTVEDRDRHIFQNRKNCTLYSIPPDSEVGEMSRCLSDIFPVISKCNVTGDWDFYDKGIQDACLSNRENQNVIFTEIFRGSRRGNTKYANVYCHICNRPRRMKKNDLCIYDEYDTGTKNLFPHFTGIIDVQIHGNTVLDFDCEQWEIWDPFSRLCRHITCPTGTLPLNGNCKSILSQSEGYTISIKFEVITNSLNVTVTNKAFLGLLENSVLPKFGSGCGLRESALIRVNNSSNLILSLTVYSTDACPVDTILTNTRQLGIQNYIRMKYGYKNTKFQVLLRLFFRHESTIEILQINQYQFVIEISRAIGSSILHYCPSIKLTRQEIFSFGLTTMDVTSSASDEHTASTTICIDTYFRARRAASDTVSSHQRYHILTWFQTLVILFFNGLV